MVARRRPARIDSQPGERILIYRLIFSIFLQRLDVERAHRLASRTLRVLTAIPPVRGVFRRFLVPHDSAIRVQALGLTFPSPLGVAAGVDKDASWFESLGLIGFGCVEVGTVTVDPQIGNPLPRVFRMTGDRALLNKMGFPNPGAKEIARRIANRRGDVVLGVNVGKGKETSLEDVGRDYRATVRLVAPFCDYLVINVSSPNTPQLREMQAVERLGPLIADVRSELAAANLNPPILIKIGPDAENEQIDAVAKLAMSLSLDGIIAVNTTEDRGGLKESYEAISSVEGGGVSGAPLKARAVEVLERLHATVGETLVLISVGGVGTPQDAWDRILAGATLIQAHSGFIYGGPMWPRRVNRGLARRVRAAGMSSIQELVGTGKQHTASAPADVSASPTLPESSLQRQALDERVAVGVGVDPA